MTAISSFAVFTSCSIIVTSFVRSGLAAVWHHQPGYSLQGLHARLMVLVILRGLLFLTLLTPEVVDHGLDGDHCPRQDDDAEAANEDVAQHGGNHDFIHCLLSLLLIF